jgi:hypothetical protein
MTAINSLFDSGPSVPPAADPGAPPAANGALRVAQVRQLVRQLLDNTDSFSQLPEAERRSAATSLVKILNFLSDPYAGIDRAAPVVVAQAQAQTQEKTFSPNDRLKERLSNKGETAGQDFKAGATSGMGKTFKDLVGAVDFPKFVSGLIEGVFSSIIKSSIKQMQAFTQMLESVAKSVDQYAKETISDAAAREYLQSTYPNALQMTVDDDGGRRISMRDGLDDGQTPNFQADLGMKEAVTPDDKESEAKIVLAAQLKMAKQRQQLLSTMVLMGINRIVVTEGEIKASVLFDVRSKDTSKRDRFANVSDNRTSNKLSESGGGWFDDSYEQDTEMRVSSAYSEEKEQSVSEIEAKAKLTGSVTVKFKSETFPLERFASSDVLGFGEKGGG